LRGVPPSKKLLLYGEIRNDNSANNGETFINISGNGEITGFGQPVMIYLLDDQIIFKAIPWEVFLKHK